MGDEIRRGGMEDKDGHEKVREQKKERKKKDKKKTRERSSITTPTMARTAMNSI